MLYRPLYPGADGPAPSLTTIGWISSLNSVRLELGRNASQKNYHEPCCVAFSLAVPFSNNPDGLRGEEPVAAPCGCPSGIDEPAKT